MNAYVEDERAAIKQGPLVRGSVALSFVLLSVITALPLQAEERPYFITYNQEMEEPGHVEIAINPLFGTQRGGTSFLVGWTEIEYGAKAWWTTEFYLAGQSTRHDSTLFTGYRWENRLRPLGREHLINPVLYLELESINGADKTLLEVVGHDSEADHATPNDKARLEHKHEIETKLILSSSLNGWTISGNLIAEKNLSNGPWEFGYAVGVSRVLASAARPHSCTSCPENLTVGAEVYGGLGTRHHLGFADTSHYAAAVLSWALPTGVTLRVSPTFGLNAASHRFLLRWGVSYEIPGFGRRSGQPRRADGREGLARTGSSPLASVPSSAHGKANPYEGSVDAARAGRRLFERHCVECHGVNAEGSRRAPALNSRTVGVAAPGDVFWFLTNGNRRAGMPSWSRLPDAHRWQLVEFLKTLAPDPAAVGGHYKSKTDPEPR